MNLLKKTAFILSLSFMIMGTLYFLWEKNYEKKLDWMTAYSDYVGNNCNSCYDFFNKLDESEISKLEVKARGIISHVAQAHITDGFRDPSKEEKIQNMRVKKLISLLLSKGANINYLPENVPGYTVLYGAVTTADSNMVEFLLNKGADTTIRDTIPGKKLLPLDAARQKLKEANNKRLKETFQKIVTLLEG